jgi:hypothetical protein
MSMGMDEFRTLLDAWGANAARWPRERQADAEALLASSEEARLLLADEAAFDALLAGMPEPTPGAALVQDILAIPRAARQDRRAGGWRFGVLPALPRFAGLTAATLLGFYIGTTSLFQPAQSMAVDTETVNISDYVFGEGIDAGSADGEAAE